MVERRLNDNEAIASVKMLPTSARKLNLVAALIRGKSVADALNVLSFSKRRIALDVKKVLSSAIANAENNHQLDIDRLVVSEVLVGKSIVLKRFNARARGRGARILKPFSNLKIKVAEVVVDMNKSKSAKKMEKGA
ncbi:MAG: 50S ribosomal protein L22 [Alphaproteobacteria bacterium]|jgi:large subunit ribosomal protein L22|nr:50S ribosomal protein L22 [Alphaproteobacteria bacterium]